MCFSWWLLFILDVGFSQCKVCRQVQGAAVAVPLACSGLLMLIDCCNIQMWEAAVNLGSTAMLEGLGRVRHCTMQGRAGMSLDLSAVEKGLRTMAPAAAVSSLRLVRNLDNMMQQQTSC